MPRFSTEIAVYATNEHACNYSIQYIHGGWLEESEVSENKGYLPRPHEAVSCPAGLDTTLIV